MNAINTKHKRLWYIINHYAKYAEKDTIPIYKPNGSGKYKYLRYYFTPKYSWSIPSKNAITQIKQFVQNNQVLEIGAGRGLWAFLLQNSNVNVIPTDTKSKTKRQRHISKRLINKPFTKIHYMSSTMAVKKYPNANTLFVSWPPYENPMAYNALKIFKGNKIIYIGEGYGGCTGDNKFHEELSDNWKLTQTIEIPQWGGIHDNVFLYERRNT